MSAAARTLSVLEFLTSTPVAATQVEIGRALGIRRSTLSDLLRELEELGYVATVQRRYVPGPRLLSFVHASVQQARLSAGIMPTLEALAAATEETAIYAVPTESGADLDGHGLAVAHVESPHDVRYVGQLGRPLPLRNTQAGLVILAFSRDRDAPAADATVERRLERIRERGYAHTSDDARGVTTIAVPVRSRTGGLMGAISIVGPSERMRDAETRILPALLDTIGRLAA